MSKTYNPKKIKRQRKHGFIARMKTPGGNKALQRRRRKGRYRLAV